MTTTCNSWIPWGLSEKKLLLPSIQVGTSSGSGESDLFKVEKKISPWNETNNNKRKKGWRPWDWYKYKKQMLCIWFGKIYIYTYHYIHGLYELTNSWCLVPSSQFGYALGSENHWDSTPHHSNGDPQQERVIRILICAKNAFGCWLMGQNPVRPELIHVIIKRW